MRIAQARAPIDGASDHGTHEAIYLPDPDGIGIELAADRPRERGRTARAGDALHRGPPQPLDVRRAVRDDRRGADRARSPLATCAMGHVHLHVGDLDAATRFYRDGLGFEVMMACRRAVFVAAGGYHHHVAYNVWRGVGAPAAPADAVGLRHWTLITDGADERAAVRERLSALGSRSSSATTAFSRATRSGSPFSYAERGLGARGAAPDAGGSRPQRGQRRVRTTTGISRSVLRA